MSRIASLWHGHITLWKTYWLYGVLGGLCVNVIFMAVIATFAQSHVPLAWLFILAAGVGSLGYSVLMVVAVWRSAGHYRGFFLWPLLARIVVVLNVIQLLGRVLR